MKHTKRAQRIAVGLFTLVTASTAMVVASAPSHASTATRVTTTAAASTASAHQRDTVTPDDHCPVGPWCTWTVVNAAGGVYWRNSPNWNDPNRTPGVGIYNGDGLYLMCYAWGSPVPPYGNTLWYLAQNITRDGSSGWVNDHFLDTPGTAANPQPQTGPC